MNQLSFFVCKSCKILAAQNLQKNYGISDVHTLYKSSLKSYASIISPLQNPRLNETNKYAYRRDMLTNDLKPNKTDYSTCNLPQTQCNED